MNEKTRESRSINFIERQASIFRESMSYRSLLAETILLSVLLTVYTLALMIMGVNLVMSIFIATSISAIYTFSMIVAFALRIWRVVTFALVFEVTSICILVYTLGHSIANIGSSGKLVVRQGVMSTEFLLQSVIGLSTFIVVAILVRLVGNYLSNTWRSSNG